MGIDYKITHTIYAPLIVAQLIISISVYIIGGDLFIGKKDIGTFVYDLCHGSNNSMLISCHQHIEQSVPVYLSILYSVVFLIGVILMIIIYGIVFIVYREERMFKTTGLITPSVSYHYSTRRQRLTKRALWPVMWSCFTANQVMLASIINHPTIRIIILSNAAAHYLSSFLYFLLE